MRATTFGMKLVEHSAGWSDLIDEAFSKIDDVVRDWATGVPIAQVKQKLGELVVYILPSFPPKHR